MKKVILLNLFSAATFILFASNPPDVKNIHSGQYGYIENKGQIIDQNLQPNLAVKYLFNSNGLNVQLKANGFSYDTYTIERKAKEGTGKKDQLHNRFHLPEDQIIYHFHRIDIEFIGANPAPEIVAENVSGDYTNYYTSGTPETGILYVRAYQKITYKNLYEGIDLQFVSDINNKPKYNFIIHPGADPSLIRWKYKGALSTSLNKERIILSVAQGNLEEKIPSSYVNETSQSINVTYTSLGNHSFAFNIPSYSKSSMLTIDPVPWATYYGGSGSDCGYGIKTDTAGNVLVTGETRSSNAIATSGAHQTALSAINDAFILKTNSAGARQWSTYYGGDDYDQGFGITSDSLGNIFVTGTTTSTNAISTPGTFQPVATGGSFGEAFVIKLNQAGVRQWGTFYGSLGDEWGYGIVMAPGGFVIATGSTSSTFGMTTSSAHQTTFGGGASDAFVIKLSSLGSRVWSTYFGGNGEDIAHAVSTDAAGNIIITGSTRSSTGIATPGAHDTSFSALSDAFLVKFNSSGVRQWGTYYGGRFEDEGQGVTTDLAGNIFIAGYTKSDSNIATSGAYQLSITGTNFAGFLAKFTSNGSRSWGTYYGGLNYTIAYATATNINGDVFISGVSSAGSGISTGNGYQPILAGGQDAFLTKFNTGGNIQWGTYFGSTVNEYSYAVTTSKDGYVYMTGSTISSTNIAKPGAFQPTYGGVADAFIAAFTGYGGLVNISNDSITGTQAVCKGGTPSTLTGSLPTGGNGNYKYKWQYSILSPSSGFINAGGNDTSQNYSPAAISTQNWFRRAVYSGGSTDTTAPILISIITNVAFSVNSSFQCLTGNNFAFTDNSTTGSGTISNRKWNFGGGPADTLSIANPAKTYTGVGTYSVMLVITTSGGCKDSTTQIMNVLQKPNPGFVTNNASQCINGNNFIVTDTTDIPGKTLTRLWNFGEFSNDTSTLTPAGKIYLLSGTFNIKLISSNSGCKDSITKTVTVNPKPNPGFTINSSSQCITGNNFLFNDTSTLSSGTLTRKWNFGNGTADTSSSANPFKTYTVANSFSVKLISVSDNNCVDSVTKTIMVHPYPNVGFTINNASQCVNGNSFLFSDTSTVSSGSLTRKWNFGNGANDTSVAITPAKSYLLSGIYQVKLVAGNSACKDSVSKTVVVNPKPGVGFTINNSSQCVNGNNFLFTDTSGISSGSIQRLWSFSNGDTSTQSNPSKTFNSPNVYSSKLVETSNNGCKDSAVKTIIVNPKPNAGFTVNKTSQCLNGNNFLFSDTSKINGGTLTRNWDFGDTNFSILTTPGKSYLTAAAFTIKLVSVSNNNCKDSLTKTVTVNPQPGATATASGATAFCEGGSVTLNANSGTGLNYQWKNNATNISGANASSYSTGLSGNYKVIVSTTFGCADTSNPIGVSVNPLPVIGSISGAVSSNVNDINNYFVSAPSGTIFNWFATNGVIQNGQGTNSINIKWVAKGTGIVKLIETNSNSCTDSSFINVSVLNTGIAEINPGSFSIYPNPANDNLIIENNFQNGNDFLIIITDMPGRKVMEKTVKSDLDQEVINIIDLRTGAYIITIQNGSEITRLKFVKN